MNLQPQSGQSSEMVNSKEYVGRGERIRTSGPCLPKTVLYQAELLPDRTRPPVMAVRGRGAPIGGEKRGGKRAIPAVVYQPW